MNIFIVFGNSTYVFRGKRDVLKCCTLLTKEILLKSIIEIFEDALNVQKVLEVLQNAGFLKANCVLLGQIW